MGITVSRATEDDSVAVRAVLTVTVALSALLLVVVDVIMLDDTILAVNALEDVDWGSICANCYGYHNNYNTIASYHNYINYMGGVIVTGSGMVYEAGGYSGMLNRDKPIMPAYILE